MSEPQAARYPAHIHLLSPALTLQGAVAHCDMPVESGPTLYLPHSHKYDAGYLAFHRPEFTRYFEDHYVQLPLEKGDAAFFNPALFHGAGHNKSTDIRRMANLLQVSSAFGRAMESVDRTAMSGPCTRHCGSSRRTAPATGSCATSSPRPLKATASPLILTVTSRWEASPLSPRLSWSGGACRKTPNLLPCFVIWKPPPGAVSPMASKTAGLAVKKLNVALCGSGRIAACTLPTSRPIPASTWPGLPIQ